MRILFALFIVFAGCASVKGKGLFEAKVADTVKIADTVKAADKITGVEQVKAADKITGVDNSQANKITAGGNISNDSVIMERYITAIKEGAKDNAKLYRYIIGGLLAQIGVLISLLGWALKFLLRSGEKEDIFNRNLIQKEKAQ